MTSFDYLILGILAASSLVGLARGLLKELLSLIAYVVAFMAAIWWSPTAASWMSGFIENSLVRTGVAYAAVFIITLLLFGLLNMTLSALIEHTGLGLADHGFGAIFGLLRGLVFSLLLVILAGYTQLPEEPWWKEARLSGAAVKGVQNLKQFIPPSLASWLPY
ncbi:CvpA family protein [Paenalcaligenes niemegkensis]|uniref:CvpA family protein n=1 Tax=Paenalcaligenes niemegkensis TaxID=2895469 RepID=UPI001EE7C97A|nr:CvpA family protein [Paenalcaligenes niemegkensis]MCQ9616280.1 CvpA family protein [Paenalcaligenes niemegkensis]